MRVLSLQSPDPLLEAVGLRPRAECLRPEIRDFAIFLASGLLSRFPFFATTAQFLQVPESFSYCHFEILCRFGRTRHLRQFASPAVAAALPLALELPAAPE